MEADRKKELGFSLRAALELARREVEGSPRWLREIYERNDRLLRRRRRLDSLE